MEWVIVGYVAILLAIGWVSSHRVKTDEDFYVAGRSVPLFASVAALLATWFGSSAIIGTTRNAYEHGLSGIVLEPLACGATLIVTGLFFAVPLWRMQLVTLAELFSTTYGPRSAWLSCAIQVPTFFCWIGAQYLSLAAIGETYLGWSFGFVVIASSILVVILTMSGGMWAVTWTETFQISIAIIGVVVLGLAVALSIGDGNPIRGVSEVIGRTPSEMLEFNPTRTLHSSLLLIGIFLTGLLGNIPGQDLLQRVFSSSGVQVARRMCVIAGILYLLIGLIPIFLGLAAHSHFAHQITDADVQGDRILPIIATNHLSLLFNMLFAIALISINIAVATSSTVSQAALLSNHVLARWKDRSSKPLKINRICLVIVTVGSIVAAYSGESVMELLEVSLAIVMCALFVPMTAAIYLKSPPRLCGTVSMISGTVVWAIRAGMERMTLWNVPIEQEHVSFPDAIAHQYGDSWFGKLAYLYAMIPSEIQGLAASLLSFLIVLFIQKSNARRGLHVN